MQMYLARHGETDGTALERYGDWPLNACGQEQIDRLAQRLSGVPLTHVYTSPMRRAWQSAEIVARKHTLTPEVLDGLREADIGAFDGLTYKEARERYPWFFAQSRVQPTLDFCWPGGETTAQVLDRAQQTWDWLWERHKNRDDVLLVVSHTYYLNLFLLAVLGLSFPNRFSFKVELAGLVHVEAANGLPPWIVFDSPSSMPQT
ncbi:MAG: histidine phosphatase family protein [Anaerolineae bacterium]|nr:histidine phosphatase family protein [Anaerolineae bacterium]